MIRGDALVELDPQRLLWEYDETERLLVFEGALLPGREVAVRDVDRALLDDAPRMKVLQDIAARAIFLRGHGENWAAMAGRR